MVVIAASSSSVNKSIFVKQIIGLIWNDSKTTKNRSSKIVLNAGSLTENTRMLGQHWQ